MKTFDRFKEKVKGYMTQPPVVVAVYQYLNGIYAKADELIKTDEDLYRFAASGWPEVKDIPEGELEAMQARLQAPLIVLVASMQRVCKGSFRDICRRMGVIMLDIGTVYPNPEGPSTVAVNSLSEIARILKKG